ncbi:TolC family protein [Marinicauda algicola]|nr:TolC family protein [Marinicauda algicola]
MRHKISFIAPVLSAALLAGCASVDYDAEQSGIFAAAAGRAAVAPADAAAIEAALAGPLTEETAVAIALANNRGLRAELAASGLARADWVEAGTLPDLAAELNIIPVEGSDILDIDLAAPVLRLLALPAYRAEARRRYDAARDRAVLEVVDFIAATRLAFVEAVAARQRAELAATVEDAVNASLLVSEELHAAGNIPAVDLDRERVQAHQVRLFAEDARLAAELAETALKARLGLEAETGLDLPSRLPDPAGEPPAAGAVAERALEASLALAAARAEAEAAATAAGLANPESLIGHVEAGAVLEREDGDWTDGLLIEAELPLFTLGHPARARARIRAEAALDRLAQLTLDTAAAARMAAREAEAAGAQARFIRESLLPTSEQALDGVMAEYNAMQIGVFDLLDAYETHIAVGRSYVDALERHHGARTRLEQVLAGGSAVAPSLEAGVPAGNPGGGQGDH